MAQATESQSAWTKKMTMRDQYQVTMRIMQFAKPYWKEFLLALIFSGGQIIATVYMPRVIQAYIDQYLATSSATVQTATMFTAIYAFLLIIQGISNYFSTYIFSMASEKTVENIRNVIFDKVIHLGMRYFDQTPGGSIVSRVTNDTETIKQFWNVFFAIFEGFATIIAVFFGMWTLNQTMALYFLLFVPLMIFAIWLYQNYSTRIYRQLRENLSQLNTKINESILGMSVIQHLRQEKRTMLEFEEQNEKQYKGHLAMVRMNALLLNSVISLFESLSIALVFYILGKQYFDGLIEVGIVFAFTQYSANFFRPMGMMMDNLSFLQDGVVSSSRILRVLDHEEHVPEQQVNPMASIKDAKIEFKNLTFSYDGEQDVLSDISFTVNPGETVAIVGHTGSGKSSIINVLMRFYEFKSGEVLIDGQSIREFSYDALREQVGLVLQDSFLFYGDVSRNIRLLNQEISDYRIREAAKFVNADAFIEADPAGYKKRVIERGASYSSGQKQLLSFARTMAREPKLLILDEATANIDTETEEYIQNSLQKMRENRSTIAIAHRLSTIKDANQIIVLDKGRIIEKGTHDDLIELGGTYFQMYRLQSMN